MTHKYIKEFMETTLPAHFKPINAAVDVILIGKDIPEEVETSNSAVMLESVAELGIRCLVGYMLSDECNKFSNAMKLRAIGDIRTKIAEVRARVDDVLDRAEKELIEKGNVDGIRG
jgi:hypothetical protein